LLGRVVVLAATVVLAAATVLTAGCSGSAAGAAGTGRPAAVPVHEPAEYAGGACLLMNFDLVNGALGTRFEVAAAGESGDTYTCVLQRINDRLPDLALAVTPTLADTPVFRDTVVPKGATVLNDLGKLGYSRTVPAADGSGPGAEVGWLSGNQRLMVLKYRAAPGGAAPGILPRLVALAKRVDQASV
jgi:hypothetical protein